MRLFAGGDSESSGAQLRRPVVSRAVRMSGGGWRKAKLKAAATAISCGQHGRSAMPDHQQHPAQTSTWMTAQGDGPQRTSISLIIDIRAPRRPFGQPSWEILSATVDQSDWTVGGDISFKRSHKLSAMAASVGHLISSAEKCERPPAAPQPRASGRARDGAAGCHCQMPRLQLQRVLPSLSMSALCPRGCTIRLNGALTRDSLASGRFRRPFNSSRR